MQDTTDPQPVSNYITDGVYIALILIVWGSIAAFFTYGVTEFTQSFEKTFTQLGRILLLTGVLNAVLYLSYRIIDYSNSAG